MSQEQEYFDAQRIDTQIEQLMQSDPQLSRMINAHVIHDLQVLYSEQQQQEQASLEGMRQRLALSVASKQQAAQSHKTTQLSTVSGPEPFSQHADHPSRNNIHQPRLNHMERAVAVLLVIAIIAAWLMLRALPHPSSGTQPVFNDANTPSLGAPVTTLRGNLTGVTSWSPDGRTFNVLGSNSQHQIIIYSTNVVTGHSTVYSALNASWFPPYSVLNQFLILQGRYLVAVRATGAHQATIEILDITEQRLISTHTIPALVSGNQVDTPLLTPSHNQQKFAMLSLDGTITIWDVASGQPIRTCTGKVSSQDQFPLVDVFPTLQWYNNDQSLLYNPGSATSHNDPYSYIAWNTATGKALFSATDTKNVAQSIISPDNKYIAMIVGKRPPTSHTQVHASAIKILNAQSGRQVRSYAITPSEDSFPNATWLPDSQHMLLQYHVQKGFSMVEQFYVWNIFIKEPAQITLSTSTTMLQLTPDQRYIIMNLTPDMRSIEIRQSINGQPVATITTPGTYPRSDSFYSIDNRRLLIGIQGNFDIWDLANGNMLYKYHGTTPYSIPGVDAGNIYFSPDDKYLVLMAGTSSTIGNGQVAIWHLP